MPDVFTTLYKPDVLSCLADLSNDEVFTPPSVVNDMLDMLPQELFESPDTTFLDPVCKSGVFLREIAKRLIKGLEDKIPDLQERIDHIFQKQLYGIAITELTSLLSRRSVYCSKYPNSKYSVSQFDDVQGNIRYKNVAHEWVKGKCCFCGATECEYGTQKRDGMESHAYEFIHTTKPQEIYNMKFDVIIGNPPYQLNTGGGQMQAKPVYQLFVQQAMKLCPKYLIMITPSRWFSGGIGLDEYRDIMLNDKRLKVIVDYSMSTDCFPGVDIAGGVNYFLWERDYNGLCRYTYIDNNHSSTKMRQLNQFSVFIRNNNALSIVNKVNNFTSKSISEQMSALSPFGLNSSVRGEKSSFSDCLTLLSSNGIGYIPRNDVFTGIQYIPKWKVVIGKATSAGAATAGKDGLRKVIATLEILPPNYVCTFSYFLAGCFDSKSEAENCKTYLSTKFVRFLLLQSLSSINISRDKFRFVPMQDFSKPWTDAELYDKYKLSQDEIDFIESMIRPME